MKTIRKKIIDLLDEFPAQMEWHDNADLANFLLSHGVTVQEWISENTSVLASTDKGIVFQCLYAYVGWDLWDGNEVNITHWQPMPQPPKGE